LQVHYDNETAARDSEAVVNAIAAVEKVCRPFCSSRAAVFGWNEREIQYEFEASIVLT
jgi:hypothetical protein